MASMPASHSIRFTSCSSAGRSANADGAASATTLSGWRIRDTEVHVRSYLRDTGKDEVEKDQLRERQLLHSLMEQNGRLYLPNSPLMSPSISNAH
eukprot:4727440-Pyramimonas_sp.AAC.2